MPLGKLLLVAVVRDCGMEVRPRDSHPTKGVLLLMLPLVLLQLQCRHLEPWFQHDQAAEGYYHRRRQQQCHRQLDLGLPCKAAHTLLAARPQPLLAARAALSHELPPRLLRGHARAAVVRAVHWLTGGAYQLIPPLL